MRTALEEVSLGRCAHHGEGPPPQARPAQEQSQGHHGEGTTHPGISTLLDGELPAKSNRLECQDAGVIGSQCFPVFAMLLSMVSSFRIQAVRASFLDFPAARRRW